MNYKFKLDSDKTENFINALNHDSVNIQLNNLTENLKDVSNLHEIDENISSFYSVMNEVCSPLFKKDVNHLRTSQEPTKLKQPWYDIDCKSKQKEFYTNLNTYRNNKSNENRIAMTKSRTEYKNLINNKKKTMIKIKQ